MKSWYLFVLGALLVCVALTCGVWAQESTAPKATTLDNLVAAFNGESNAHARYVQFALKADEEGCPKIANLFRAAARAEEIHAKNHEKVIEKMGGKAVADIKAPDVKSTKENLETALKGESYERDEMYPKFIDQAKTEANAKAMRTFNFALAAEKDHAELYKEAIDKPDEGKNPAPMYYVCPVCGRTVSKLTGDKCPVCFTPIDNFEEIS